MQRRKIGEIWSRIPSSGVLDGLNSSDKIVARNLQNGPALQAANYCLVPHSLHLSLGDHPNKVHPTVLPAIRLRAGKYGRWCRW